MAANDSGAYEHDGLNPNFDSKNLSPEEKELYVSAFLDCIQHDDLEKASRYLKTISVDESNVYGGTALHFCKSVTMYELLMEHGANVFARSKSNYPPIACCGSLEVFKLMLEKMRSIDASATPDLNDSISITGLTFFQLLIASESFSVIEWLVKDGNAQSIGLSPPHLFHFNDIKCDTMKIAVQNNAPRWLLKMIQEHLPEEYAQYKFQLFSVAVDLGGPDGIKLFAEDVDDVDCDFCFSDRQISVLMCAASNLNFENCKTLLELGANPNKVSGDGLYSPALAVINEPAKDGSVERRLELLQLFADYGATFSDTYINGHNLLTYAINMEPELFDFIASKAPPAAFDVNVDSKKLIHFAANRESVEFLKSLFKYAPPASIDVNEFVNGDVKQPALYIAASAGYRDNCMFLLENGANPDIKVCGRSISEIAEINGHIKLAEELKTFQTEQPWCCFYP